MQSLNLRLTIAIFAIAIAVIIVLLGILRVLYFDAAAQQQATSLQQLQSFVDHPDYDQALTAMPEDLAANFTRVHEQLTNTATYFATILKWQWLIFAVIAVALSPLVIVLSLFVSRRLTLPLRTLAVSTRQLAKGDFRVRATPNPKSWDSYSLALAKDFNTMAASLEHLNNERQNMIADIAHELRTPLTSMQLQLEALQDGIDPLTPEVVDHLYDESKLLSRLIVDLRMLSLAEAKQLSLTLEQVDLYNLVERTLRAFQPQAKGKRIDLRLVGDSDSVIEADTVRIMQIVNNLLSNALRHTPEGGQVTVKLESQDDVIELSVLDTGTGLSEEDLARVFNRFYRSDKGRVRSEGGSGLGLAVVKALVELHGGSVSISNRAEGGAVSTITLPS